MKHGRNIAVLLLVVVLMLPAFAGAVFADDFNDEFYFEINPSTITQYAWSYINPAAEKSDFESMYLYYDGNQEEVAVRAMGCTNTKGAGLTNVSYYGTRYVEYFICEPDTPYRIVNHVREDCFNYCTLGFFPKDFGGSLSGFWYPSVKVSGYEVPTVGAYVE